MNADGVRLHMEETKDFLTLASNHLTAYLDDYNYRITMEEDKGARADGIYIKRVFKQIRKMEVMFDEALERMRYLLNKGEFAQDAAEKTLFKIYQMCVVEFYSPQSDLWFEESRAAYTNQPSIRFRGNPPLSLKKLFAEIEPYFEVMRETLVYYDTKYQENFL